MNPAGDLPLLAVWVITFVVVTVTVTAVPIPAGYDRGKVKFITWCSTGMHWHITYWTENGFQTLHPDDREVDR